MILMVIGGFLETCSVSLIMPFMEAVMNPDKIMKKSYVQIVCEYLHIQTERDFLMILAIVLAAVYIVKNLYLLWEYRIQYRFVYRNRFIKQSELLATILSRPYEYFLNINSAEVIRLINNDLDQSFALLAVVLSLYTEMVVSVCIIGTIFVITPMVTLCIAVVMLILLVVISKFLKPVLQQAGEDNRMYGQAMDKWLLQSVHGIKEVKVMHRESYFKNQYDKNGNRYVDTFLQKNVLNLIPRFSIEAISMGTLFIMVAVLIYRGMELEALVPMLSAVAMAAIRLLPSVNRMSQAIGNIAFVEPMVDKVNESLRVLDQETEELKDATPDVNQTTGVIQELNSQIELRDITFKYPLADQEILTQANMVIHKGESIGVVGASGAGKTTSIDILLGLLHPQSGQILCDDQDIRTDMPGWLRQIGYIPQMIFMLDDTIRANVAFGVPESEVSDEQVWRALREASLEEYVHTLPDGLDTTIGERGMRLSGGQRQRIGIARALYLNPSILVFDEATSALDNQTEADIMESINHLRGQKTMIIIAHRLTTIEQCDHVYRVENQGIYKER